MWSENLEDYFIQIHFILTRSYVHIICEKSKAEFPWGLQNIKAKGSINFINSYFSKINHKHSYCVQFNLLHTRFQARVIRPIVSTPTFLTLCVLLFATFCFHSVPWPTLGARGTWRTIPIMIGGRTASWRCSQLEENAELDKVRFDSVYKGQFTDQEDLWRENE